MKSIPENSPLSRNHVVPSVPTIVITRYLALNIMIIPTTHQSSVFHHLDIASSESVKNI
jgi:hypothetical protein